MRLPACQRRLNVAGIRAVLDLGVFAVFRERVAERRIARDVGVSRAVLELRLLREPRPLRVTLAAHALAQP